MSSVPKLQSDLAQAISLWQAGRPADAQRLCETVASRGDPVAMSLLAEIHTAARRPAEANKVLVQLAELRPTDASVQRRLGDSCLAIGACEEAVESYRRALAIEPRSARGHNNLGQALMQLRRYDEAAASYERALEADPRYAIAYNNRGIVHYQQGEYTEAVACYEKALEIDPRFAQAHNNRGNALLKLKRPQEALECFERALSMKTVFLGRGNALHELERFDEAVDSYERALQLEPDNPEALSNCAGVLLTLRQPEKALEYCRRAIALKPDFAEAYNNMAGALLKLGRYEEATSACETALQLRPDYAAALSNMGHILVACGQYTEALEYCERALALVPDLVEAHDQYAGALIAARRPEDAARAYARLLDLDPEYRFAQGGLLSARLACCDWSDYSQSVSKITQGVRDNKPVIMPFTFLAVSDSAELQLRCARIYAADQVPPAWRMPWRGARYQHERIRIAYLSADYHQHATAILMAGVFEAHDRNKFEIIGVSFGRDDAGAMRQRLLRGFDRFIDVRRKSDAEIVALLHSLEIDIAVDLKGFTGDSRPGLFARRPAPVQVNYLGYPGTMGLEQFDYLLADPIVLPPEQRPHCSEAIACLPECYQANDDKRELPCETPTRTEAGLPEGAFVFCCFNNNYKIGPAMFDVWMDLLRRTPGSVLWLLEDNPTVARNLRHEAQARGVSAERLVFAPRTDATAHLSRHRLADLFLDTLPYNAHTTTSDALWAGLPVLTCLGSVFPGRVAASLLNAIGLPELVTRSLEEYTARALELAQDAARLRELRDRLAYQRTRSPLFDTARFCRHLESAYDRMWLRHQEGLPPEDFSVSALALPVTET
jgi:predicted O-linked N-acetylglucosamine transferase (SPINDLY family)